MSMANVGLRMEAQPVRVHSRALTSCAIEECPNLASATGYCAHCEHQVIALLLRTVEQHPVPVQRLHPLWVRHETGGVITAHEAGCLLLVLQAVYQQGVAYRQRPVPTSERSVGILDVLAKREQMAWWQIAVWALFTLTFVVMALGKGCGR